jgi:hypothetical protein
MELILNLEEKFAKFESKLNSSNTDKIEQIDNSYSKDCDAIHRIFDSKQEKYKNGLNERRDGMVKQIIQKRDEQLGEVNEFIQEMEPNNHQKQLNKLRRLADSIESNYISFARSLISVNDSILYRIQLGNQLNMRNLVKYLRLLTNEQTVSLKNISTSLDNFKDVIDFFILPHDRILLLTLSTSKVSMEIIDKNGDLIKSKEITGNMYCNILDEDYLKHIYVNKTHIIAYYLYDKLVEIYNFNLELVHSFKVDRDFAEFRLNNYEIAFLNSYKSMSITCYTYKTIRTKANAIFLDKDEFKRRIDVYFGRWEFFFLLIELNDKFVFIQVSKKFNDYNSSNKKALLILNREDDYNLYKYFLVDGEWWFLYNSEVFYHHLNQIYTYDTNSANNDAITGDGDELVNVENYNMWLFTFQTRKNPYKYDFFRETCSNEMIKFSTY